MSRLNAARLKLFDDGADLDGILKARAAVATVSAPS
jgi:hypothetical protein